jgi:hypothetical protein
VTGEYVITEPGVYDIPEDAYHADPVPGGSLSYSGAKKLLPPSCPAIFHYERTHPKPPTQAMELGTAAHKLVLGVGQELAIIDAENWRGGKAKEAADAARAEGKIPLLTHEHDTVQEMAAAIRRHKLASALLDDRRGDPEQSLFWRDEHFGIWKRCRLDWMPGSGERAIVDDYKTCASAEPAAIAKAVANFGYHQQAAWYSEGFYEETGEWPVFLFIFQEKTPPYIVTVVQLDDEAMKAGRAANEWACEIYRDCTESGIWPAYSDDVELIALPRWARTREDYL